jgi:hypothetical protein
MCAPWRGWTAERGETTLHAFLIVETVARLGFKPVRCDAKDKNVLVLHAFLNGRCNSPLQPASFAVVPQVGTHLAYSRTEGKLYLVAVARGVAAIIGLQLVLEQNYGGI